MNDRAKSTLILAILCAAILLVILTGCGKRESFKNIHQVQEFDGCVLVSDDLGVQVVCPYAPKAEPFNQAALEY